MKTPTDEEAWEAALDLALQERYDAYHREEARQSKIGRKLRAEHESIKTGDLEVLAEHPKAGELMDEAREYAALQTARDDAIRASILGELSQNVGEMRAYDYRTPAQIAEFYLANYDRMAHFVAPDAERAWRAFCETIAAWDVPAIFAGLCRLLELAKAELLRTGLPPTPVRRGEERKPGTDDQLLFALPFGVLRIANAKPTAEQLPHFFDGSLLDDFDDESALRDWGQFLEAASKCDVAHMLEGLSGTLSSVMSELLFTELPQPKAE